VYIDLKHFQVAQSSKRIYLVKRQESKVINEKAQRKWRRINQRRSLSWSLSLSLDNQAEILTTWFNLGYLTWPYGTGQSLGLRKSSIDVIRPPCLTLDCAAVQCPCRQTCLVFPSALQSRPAGVTQDLTARALWAREIEIVKRTIDWRREHKTASVQKLKPKSTTQKETQCSRRSLAR
jgi:hypothetical protein